MNNQPVRVGIIGAGFNATFQARAMMMVRGAEVVAVLAPNNGARIAEKCREFEVGNPKVCTSVKDMCDSGVEMITINAPNFLRLVIMREIEQHGKGKVRMVCCEKPLARNMKEAKEMAALAAGFRTSYFENQVHMPLIRNCKAQLAGLEAEMGAPYIVRTAEEHAGPHSAWFWDPTKQGGGVFEDMGCHSASVGWYLGNPKDKPVNFLRPHRVTAKMSLSKWGREKWRNQLLEKHGVDYTKTPAEDYAAVNYTFKNPETDELVEVQAIDSWCYSAPGLKLQMECMSPGNALSVNTLVSPGEVFIADYAGGAIGNAEEALEKSEASTGRLNVMEFEPLTYGYVNEMIDAVQACRADHDGFLNFDYGVEVMSLVMAGYMAHEQAKELTFGPELDAALAEYVPKIQQGKGAEVLFR